MYNVRVSTKNIFHLFFFFSRNSFHNFELSQISYPAIVSVYVPPISKVEGA